MKCFSVDVYIYSFILCFSDCHVSTCAFLVVMLIYLYNMHYFIVLVIISVCVKCFNIDVHIYSTLLLLPFLFVFFCFVCFILAFLSF